MRYENTSLTQVSYTWIESLRTRRHVVVVAEVYWLWATSFVAVRASIHKTSVGFWTSEFVCFWKAQLVISSHLSCRGSLWVAFLHAPHYEGSDRGQTITAKKNSTKSMNSHPKTQQYVNGKSPLFLFYREKGKIMIFSVRRPQYFISHTKSQRLLVTRNRLSYEKVNLHNTLVTWAWGACGACCG